MTQTDIFTYPQSPGYRTRETSRNDAEHIAPRVPTLRDRALRMIRVGGSLDSAGGLTADEVAADLNESILAIRPRITELSKLGLIVDSGIRRKNGSGRQAIVWRVA